MQGVNVETAAILAEWITALATGIIAIAAWLQLPMISKQVSGLAEQIRLSREAEANAERRTREWETLKICERFDFDPVLDGATSRIWAASEEGSNYFNQAVDKRDIICLLNYLDHLSTGIDQGLYIEDVIRDHLSIIFKHAVENFILSNIISDEGVENVVAKYRKWFKPPPVTNYQSNAVPPAG